MPIKWRIRRHLDNRWCLFGATILAFLASARLPTHAQGCDNNDTIYQGGSYCIAATNPTTGNNPWMPTLQYGGNGNACDTYVYGLELDFAQPGALGNGQSYGLYFSSDEVGNLPGNVPWTVNWSMNEGDVGEYSEGGNGDVDTYINAVYADSISFFVYGQNPTTPSITAALGLFGPPWWYGHTLTWETLIANKPAAGSGYTGNVQFYGISQFDPSGTYTGTPVFGKPDGFGLSQLDGSAHPSLLTDDSLWTWTTNLMYGVQVASGTQTAAYNHFQLQLNQMLQQTGGSPQYPNPVGGYCNLTWNGTGNNAYWNADWINLYNGGYWATWTGSGWSYGNSTNPTYTSDVCNQPSWTI